MNQRRFSILAWLAFCVLAVPTPSAAAGPTAASTPSASDMARLSDRMDQLETCLRQVESEVGALRDEKRRVEENLEGEKQKVAALKVKLAEREASTPGRRPTEGELSDRPAPFAPTTQWGTRLGYQGFPFEQKEGGFYYGFFISHALADEADGLPLGELDAEIGLGIARSGSDHVVVSSAVVGQNVPVEFRQTILSLWPGLKYYFDRWAPMGIRPYVVGGPGIWGDLIESPPLFVGQAPPAPQFANRKLPVDAAANVFEGGQGGAGIELSLARTGVPILERLNVGFDYRYSAWTSGERFNTYTFSLSSGD